MLAVRNGFDNPAIVTPGDDASAIAGAREDAAAMKRNAPTASARAAATVSGSVGAPVAGIVELTIFSVPEAASAPPQRRPTSYEPAATLGSIVSPTPKVPSAPVVIASAGTPAKSVPPGWLANASEYT